MTEPTQEQLLTYIDAAMTFYEKVNGQGQVPTDRQIHELLAACGVYVAFERIKVNRDVLSELVEEAEIAHIGNITRTVAMIDVCLAVCYHEHILLCSIETGAI